MPFITATDRTRIVAALKQAEQTTSGELVCVVARSADTYLLAPTLAAAAIALLLPGLVWFTGWLTDFPSLYVAQLTAFAAFALIFHHPDIAARLVPRAVKTQRARRLAREQFFEQRLHTTSGQTGILLFVSIAERHVEIMADSGIDAVVPNGTWDKIVADFTAQVRGGQVGEGFVAAITAMGEILARQAPRGRDDRNELPDRLIEI